MNSKRGTEKRGGCCLKRLVGRRLSAKDINSLRKTVAELRAGLSKLMETEPPGNASWLAAGLSNDSMDVAIKFMCYLTERESPNDKLTDAGTKTL